MSTRKLILVVGMLGVLLMASAVLAATTRFSGYIASNAQDRYSVSYRAGQSVVADLVCDEPPTLDTILQLFDSNNTPLAYNDDGGSKTCGGFHSSRIVFTFPETGTYTWQVQGFGSSSGPYTLSIVDGVAGFVPSDDRINAHAFAPVAVYCRDAGSVEVWNIDSAGQGTVLFNVSGADVTAGANGAALDSAGAVTLSKLSDGRLQVSAPMLDGKGYLFIFDGCPVHSSETYTVENGNAVLFETRNY